MTYLYSFVRGNRESWSMIDFFTDEKIEEGFYIERELVSFLEKNDWITSRKKGSNCCYPEQPECFCSILKGSSETVFLWDHNEH